MRVKKAGINVFVSLVTYIISFFPVFIVRKMFLTYLGEELLGLSSLYTNIIGLLAIVELGIGTAIIFALYKPFAEDDKVKIKGYVDFYAKFYRITGCIVSALGLCIIPFLNFFIKGQVGMVEARIYFILFLVNTVISYFFSYKLCMLYVSQQGYKVSILNTAAKVAIAVLQIISLKLFASFYIYLIIQIVVNLIYYLVTNLYIDKNFKWLKTTDGHISNEEKSSLSKNMKALFIHKLGGLIVLGTDNILISTFLNLNIVAKFNSYNMVISSAQSIIISGLSSITASIGNLLTEEDNDKSYEVHKKLFFINFWIASFVTISLFNTLEQFVVIWLDKTQLIDSFTVAILLINLYFMLMRSSIDSFKEAGGIYYQDRYVAIIEAVVNLVSSLILVKLIGLPGIFLGTLISNFGVIFWIKPMLVYKYIFKKEVKNYFKVYFKYMLVALVPLVTTIVITSSIKNVYTISFFLLNCVINIIVINVIYMVVFRNTNEFKYYKNIAMGLIKKIK
ncbi:lipopolysaccharide biosynthesis protein [Clostridium culturomicium]|uniref:lipopolysaccharide biosynthesis protein n=1 Tax=Clostridium culturomicium TaxID=1499683 RepID=UPI003857D5A8